jgi:hypothetical protein
MMRSGIALIGTFLLLAGCSTKTNLNLPPNTEIRINHKPPALVSGPVKVRPFFWNNAAGVRYVLTSIADGGVVKTGRLPTRFRVVSIFWPPYALIYWPLGFACEGYDLTQANESLYCQ